MKTIQKIACTVAAACLLGAGGVMAEEKGGTVLVTGAQVGKGSELIVEYLADGSAVGLQVELLFEGIDVSKVSLSGCAAPKSGAKIGTCRFNGNKLVYATLNAGLKPLESTTLAKIRIPAQKGAVNVTPVRMLTSDAKGIESQGELLVDMYGEVQAK